jgi:hypothetical protein
MPVQDLIFNEYTLLLGYNKSDEYSTLHSLWFYFNNHAIAHVHSARGKGSYTWVSTTPGTFRLKTTECFTTEQKHNPDTRSIYAQRKHGLYRTRDNSGNESCETRGFNCRIQKDQEMITG